MRILSIIILSIILTSCTELPRTSFLRTCESADQQLTEGVEHSILNDRIHLLTPSKNWPITQSKNGFVMGDTSLGFINTIAFFEYDYKGDWEWDEQIESLTDGLKDNPQIELLEHSIGRFKGSKALEILTLEDDPNNPRIATLTFCYLNQELRKNYQLSISVDADSNYENRICELIPIAKSIEIRN